MGKRRAFTSALLSHFPLQQAPAPFRFPQARFPLWRGRKCFAALYRPFSVRKTRLSHTFVFITGKRKYDSNAFTPTQCFQASLTKRERRIFQFQSFASPRQLFASSRQLFASPRSKP